MNTIIIILFIIFSCLIYFITNTYLILAFLLITILSIYLLKINLRGLKNILFFITLTILINLIFSSILESILIGIRLLVIYFLTLIINHYMSSQDIAKSITNLIFFIKEKRDLEIIISISLTLIPIMIDEVSSIKKSLISKNFNFNLKNVIKKPNIFLITYLNNIFKRINELEFILKSKGYE